ncbi:VCBS repeat-containing protein [Candidatus Nomurabacteria bacterium]|nr:VCBS repeat-containing protein [Candidatus Nomurabacteria bacterium]
MKQKHWFCMSGRTKLASQLSAFLLAFLFVFSPIMPIFAEEIDNPNVSLPTISVDEKPIIAPDPIDIGPLPPTIEPPSIEPPKTEPPISDVPPTIEPPTIEPPKDDNKIDPETTPPPLVEMLPAIQTKENKTKIDQKTGGLGYSYELKVPQGRNSITPQLILSYSSNTNNEISVFGNGWDISIPSIKRLNKYGVEKMYESAYEVFSSSLDGELVLVGSSSHTYRPKTENGDFRLYKYINNTWSFTDKSGTTFSFGNTAQAREDNPNDVNKVYKWMLESVTDTNNNFQKFNYYKETGQIYPDTISYTGNGVTEGVFSIVFSREARVSALSSFSSGFNIITSKRISEVRVDINGSWVKKYSLTYKNADNGQDALLGSITESGRSEQTGTVTTKPSTTFDYTVSIPGWTYIPYTSFPFYTEGLDSGFRLGDINGDGLVDSAGPQISVGNGSSFVETPTWQMPPSGGIPGSTKERFSYIESGVVKPVSLFEDINGDNLPDVIHRNNSNIKYVYLNNGINSWLDPTTNSYSASFPFPTEGPDTGFRLGDVNGDGLVDSVGPQVSINNGSSFVDSNYYWQMPPMGGIPGSTKEVFSYMDDRGSVTQKSILTDLNGDGLPDIASYSSYYPHLQSVYLNNTKTKVNLLKTITNSTGEVSSIEYKSSAQYKDANGNLLNDHLPYIIYTVSKITDTDPNTGVSSRTEYTYSGGEQFYASYSDKEFAGFQKVEEKSYDNVTNVLVKKTISYFHQGDVDSISPIKNVSLSGIGENTDVRSKIGKVFRTEIYDGSGNLYQVDITKWDNSNIATGSDFVYTSQMVSKLFNGTSTSKDTATTYVYDSANGNLLTQTNFGEVTGNNDGSFVDTGSDKFTTSYTYASGTNVSLPSSSSTVDQSSNKVKESKYYYDNLSFGSATKGNLTKQENWKSGSTYVNNQKSYNTYGLVTSSTNELGKVTNYAYDSYNLYPATVTDPLSHTTQYLYDYGVGKPKQITDQNGFVYQNVFDGLGRITQEKIPDFVSPSTSVLKTSYEYTDTVNNVSVHKVDYLDSSNTIDTYIYFDGLGRKIQERKEAETGYSVKDYGYNSRGLLDKESLPYNSSGTARTTPTSTSTLYTTYNYDPIERVTVSTNAVGSTLYSYNDWKTTITDANGKQKSYYKDAYGNLVKVDEVNAGTTYTTSYSYNGNNKLTNITDALGNVRGFTYDGLGRRLTAQDLHATTDATFGSWSYVYDDAGNMTQSINPEGNVVNYSYDDINRLQSEDYTGSAGVEVSYTYDSCTKGIGKLCSSVVSSGGNNSYAYDSLGNIISDTATVDGNVYITSYVYDKQNNLSLVTYPDNAEAKYTYNTAGLLEKIERKENGGTFTDVVSGFDYSPMEQVSVQTNANGITTTNTCDSGKLYRLVNKKTVSPAPLSKDPKPELISIDPLPIEVMGKGIPIKTNSPVTLQDLSYTYDNVGNITKIVDASNTATAKTSDYVYDDLYRLTSATITGVPSGQNTYTQTFTYDAIGNITSGSAGTYLYQGNTGTNYANPHAATSVGGVEQTYDKNGNLISSGNTTYSWNYKGKLAQTTFAGIQFKNYYNAKDDRVKTNSFSSINSYYPNKLYSTDCYNCYDRQPPGERQIKLIKQIYAKDTTVATIETLGSTVTPYYNHTDHLNSIIIVTDQNKNTAQTLDYYPYGKERTVTPPGDYISQRQYIGQIHDINTGLDYLNARYYKADRGQFISEDPVFWEIGQTEDGKKALLNPQAQNSYGYANGNPITYSDPDGKFLDTILDVGFTLYDIGLYAYHASRGENTNSDKVALSLDAGAIALPGITGLGVMSRVAKVGEEGARVANNIIKVGDTISGLKVTTHAAEGFVERNMQSRQVITALQRGTKYLDTKTNNILHTIGERGKGGYTVITDRAQKTLVSVENFVRNLSSKSSIERFKKFKK